MNTSSLSLVSSYREITEAMKSFSAEGKSYRDFLRALKSFDPEGKSLPRRLLRAMHDLGHGDDLLRATPGHIIQLDPLPVLVNLELGADFLDGLLVSFESSEVRRFIAESTVNCEKSVNCEVRLDPQTGLLIAERKILTPDQITFHYKAS